MPNGDNAHRDHFRGYAQEIPYRVEVKGPSETGRQPLIHHGEQQDHDRAADVHVPVRYRPFDLRAVLLELVRLLVAAVVGFLAGAGYHKHGRSGYPGVEASLYVVLFSVDL